MTVAFVDTGAWLAMAVRRDQYHEAAAQYYRQLSSTRTRLLTSNYVLVETFTGIRYDDGHLQAVRFHTILEVEWVNRQIHEEAWSVFEQYSDQIFSLVDCTSFVIARTAGVDEVFGFDHGFETMGFLLRPGW